MDWDSLCYYCIITNMDGEIGRYQVIESQGLGDYREKGSKFFGFAFPIQSEDEFKEQLQEIKSNHPKASHWCTAFAIGPEQEFIRSNDDGEPSGSAGLPILNAIKSSKLSDIGVVVVRYYGGTNLGVSGLIHAYGASASEAIENAATKEKVLTRTIELSCKLEESHIPMQILGKHAWKTIDTQFTEANCVILAEVPIDELGLWEEVFKPYYTISYSVQE